MQPAAGEPLDDGERIENRTVHFIVGSELQRVEKPNKHGAVVRPVGAPHHGVELLPIGWPGGLELPHQIPQSGLVRNGINDLFD